MQRTPAPPPKLSLRDLYLVISIIPAFHQPHPGWTAQMLHQPPSIGSYLGSNTSYNAEMARRWELEYVGNMPPALPDISPLEPVDKLVFDAGQVRAYVYVLENERNFWKYKCLQLEERLASIGGCDNRGPPYRPPYEGAFLEVTGQAFGETGTGGEASSSHH